MLKITNNNTFSLTDRYDGQDYTFPPGKTVRCPMVVAQHFFGIGDPNKLPYLARQGWSRTSQDKAIGMEILDNFSFEMIDQGPQDDLAINQQGAAPLQSETGEESETDGSPEMPVSTLRGDVHSGKRNILSRLAPA